MLTTNVTFANFDLNCGSQDFVISSNPYNDDTQFPVTFEQTFLANVNNDSKVFLFRPNLGKIKESECGDMDCDGLKKNLLNDLDGSFLGAPGTVLSQSDYGWGTAERGLGDFRIPRDMLTALDGSFINPKDIYNHTGIVRDENSCTYESSWQGYQCYGMKYKMLIIESMDSDTGIQFN